MVASSEPEASVAPSGEKDTLQHGPTCGDGTHADAEARVLWQFLWVLSRDFSGVPLAFPGQSKFAGGVHEQSVPWQPQSIPQEIERGAVLLALRVFIRRHRAILLVVEQSLKEPRQAPSASRE
jgi:hypothetical protein